jgi:hypothetical protein
MTLTLEARWFGAPPLPDALREWFSELGSIRTAEQTDLYLPAEDPAVNLKLRDNQFQIKRRLAGPFRTSLGPNAAGRCEQWVKWSFELEEAASLWDQDPTALWVPVKKTRHQLTIPPEAQSSLTPALPAAPPASIELELTTLKVDSETAWTLCIEAEGPVSSLVDTLTTAAPQLLDDRLPISLSSDQSFGYIRWLLQLPTVSRRPAPEVRISPPQARRS